MVFLKRIDLSGFKTFARRTSVTFDQRLNVIIGPNGSGKTNIIDAIQFVLGERSPRLLRATNFAGLLFSGKGDMPRARHASVSLHLANRDRRIPVDTDEVVISRHVGPDGNSTFRLNGKRCSLSNLLDVLSSAALTGGMNVIHQGTTMRLADFSPEDRRRDVERILGIADYDRKKEEATVELRDAETNLKVARSKYDTVKERLLELERERNELLSYNYIKGELSRLKAAKLSTSLNGLRKRHQELSSLIGEKNQRLTEIKSKREQLDGELREKRREWQDYTERVVEKGGEQLLVLQKAIGDVNSDVAGLQTAISLAKTNLQAYENMRHDKQDTLSSIRDQIISARKESKKLQREKSRLEELLKEREKTRTQLLTDIANIKGNVEENANRLRTVEEQLDTLAAERAKLDVAVKAHGESVDILADQMQTLEVRKKESENVLATVASRYKEVSVLKRKEDKRLESLVQAIDRNTRQKQALEMEIRNADRVVKQARKSVTEFESRKSLAESVLSEEKALEHIEALVDARALRGIHGRLSEKVKIRSAYKMAVEAAAEGWLQALIAEDMETVRRCAESLKRSKIGRVKLIPLSNVQGLKSIEKPSVPGVQGTVASYVECVARYRPAVNFVLGDTFIAADEDAALRLSDMGYRAVTPDGEVYEPGFRLEVGFYREHIDLAEVVPSDNAIKGISETVNTFEGLLQRRSVELQNLGDELIRLEGEKALQAESMRYFEYELSQMEQNLERTHKYVVELNRKLRSLRTKHQNISGLLSSHASRQSEIDGQLHTLRLEIVPLRRRVKPEAITMLEGESAEVEAAINELRRTLNEVESKIATLESNVQNIHVPSFSTVRGEMMGINRNISSMTRKIQDSTERLQSANSKLKEMGRQKEKHSEMMLAGKEESKKFDKEISDLEKE
ncbi:MAG: AAA family ATPase, partial [Candidatus Bathyarchaeia archaeon]